MEAKTEQSLSLMQAEIRLYARILHPSPTVACNVHTRTQIGSCAATPARSVRTYMHPYSNHHNHNHNHHHHHRHHHHHIHSVITQHHHISQSVLVSAITISSHVCLSVCLSVCMYVSVWTPYVWVIILIILLLIIMQTPHRLDPSSARPCTIRSLAGRLEMLRLVGPRISARQDRDGIVIVRRLDN